MARNVQQKAVIRLPSEFSDFTPVQRLAAAREVVKFIRERTEKGLDKDNKSFKSVSARKDRPLKGKYTAAYVDSLDFKNAGKSRTPINLALSGDMLASIKVLNFNEKGKITIGLDKGDEDNGKMEGNRKGTYGQSKPVAPKRDPLGITEDDLRSILSKISLKDKKTVKEVESARDGILDALTVTGKQSAKAGQPFDDVSTSISFTAKELEAVRARAKRLADEALEEVES